MPSPLVRMKEFLSFEAWSGLLLVICALIAIVLANSPAAGAYDAILATTLGGSLGNLSLSYSLRHWINDGLMAIFFLVVGLEIKRELVIGELRDPRTAALPAIAALGGMLLPAMVYVSLRFLIDDGTGEYRGWAVPMATDIAFVVGCLALLGNRVPHALRIFVLSLAIIDDLGAIVIIAFVYAKGVAVGALLVAAAALGIAAGMARARIANPWAYAPVALVTWLAFHESGVHATVAGVLLGLLAPVHPFPGRDESLLETVEHALHPVVAIAIMPIFALANAGVALGTGGGWQGDALAIAAGLLVGKPIGILVFSWLAVGAGLGRLPDAVTWPLLSGAGILAGIGFTMALFIASLAMADEALETAKLGVMTGSAVSAVIGLTAIAAAARTARSGPPHP